MIVMKSIWNKWLKQSVFIYCVLYTLATVFNSVLFLIKGHYEDPSGNWHELDRAIIVLIVVLAYTMIKHLKIRHYLLKALVVYVPTLTLALIYVWVAGFRDVLAGSAYKDVFITYTVGFSVIAVVGYIVNIIRKAKK